MRVAVYGVGHMGRHHVRHLGELGHDVIVVDPPRGLDPSVDGVEAVVVATPTPNHAAVALPWLRRGVPVLVEKPLAETVAVARELAAFPTLAVGHTERFNPTLDLLKERPAFWQAERLAPWMDRGTDVDVVLDLMIHDLDLFLGHVGGDVRDVRANGLSVVSGRIDIVHARVETTNGVGLFTASRISRKAVRTIRAFVPGGYYSLDLKDKVGVHVDGELKETALTVEPRDALRAELVAFLAGDFPVRGEEAVAALELAERVRCACS